MPLSVAMQVAQDSSSLPSVVVSKKWSTNMETLPTATPTLAIFIPGGQRSSDSRIHLFGQALMVVGSNKAENS